MSVTLATTIARGTDLQNLGANSSGGQTLGSGITELISFYGTTAVAQRAGITQATVTLTLTTGGVGFVTTAQAQAVVDQINEIRAMLTANGMWKGSA